MPVQPSRTSRFTFRLLTVMFLLVLAGGLFAAVSIPTFGREGYSVEAQVPREQIGSVPEPLELAPFIDVVVRVRDASVLQLLLASALVLLTTAASAYGLWLLRGVAGSVKDADPFAVANVRRLRRLGVLVLAAPLTVTYLQSAVTDVVLRGTQTQVYTSGRIDLDGSWAVAALCLFVLAEVFAHGVRLREDLEGTV